MYDKTSERKPSKVPTIERKQEVEEKGNMKVGKEKNKDVNQLLR